MPVNPATPLNEVPFVVFDTETTGLSHDDDGIIEIAGVRVQGGIVHESDMFESLVNPVRPIPYDAQRVHGITDAMVADAHLLETVLPQFLGFADDAVLVAHNASFDIGFINPTLEAMGWGPYRGPVVCTLRLSRYLYPDERRHDLDTITKRLGLPPLMRHRAAGDALQTARTLLRFCDRLLETGHTTYSGLDPAVL